MKTGVTDKGRKEVSEGLMHFLADTYALYLKTQNFHWNVTGAEFYSLHILFEKQYTELAEAIDEIAEKVRALGFFVDATFSNFHKMTCIEDDKKNLSAKQMLKKLLEAHEALDLHAHKLTEIAEAAKDYGTVDLMARRINTHEKAAWMLRCSL